MSMYLQEYQLMMEERNERAHEYAKQQEQDEMEFQENIREYERICESEEVMMNEECSRDEEDFENYLIQTCVEFYRDK